jgi:hypothetical protein
MADKTTERNAKMQDFLNRVNEAQVRFAATTNWHMAVHTATGLDLPWDVETHYVNVNVHDEEYNIDVDATLDMLAKITQYASSQGKKIEKKYDYEFEVVVTIWEHPSNEYRNLKIRYTAKREAVCLKKIVGTKEVAEQVIPSHTEEIVEWECEKIALLSRDV